MIGFFFFEARIQTKSELRIKFILLSHLLKRGGKGPFDV